MVVCYSLIDWVVVLRPTRCKIGHFGDVSPSQPLGLMLKKAKPQPQQKNAFTNKKTCTTTQNKHKQLKPALVAFYDIRPGNAASLFSRRKISKEGDKWRKSEEKRRSGEAYDINKQTIYIAPKSQVESRAHYARHWVEFIVSFFSLFCSILSLYLYGRSVTFRDNVQGGPKNRTIFQTW